MKMLFSLLLVSALATACSSGGGGGSAGPGGGPGADFKPTEKPANAASMQDVEALVNQLKNTEALIPGNEAIFKMVLSGADSVPVSAQDKEAAIRKLNGVGATFLSKILTKCTISDARTTGSSQPTQVNVPAVANGYLSTRGAACPFIVNEQMQSETTYTSASNTSVVGVAKMSMLSRRDIMDSDIVSKTGVLAVNQTMNMVNNFSYSQVNNKMTSMATLSGTGDLEVRLLDQDGEFKIAGPMAIKGVLNDASIQVQTLFEGTSKKGAIRVVLIIDSKTGAKLFVNGQEISEEKIGGLPKALSHGIR
ncbi:MAG: hypothetical protein HUU57_11500 [Bdellovibrio sp.]|nr:hypothetical protein [Bdellovibrio sp.]